VRGGDLQDFRDGLRLYLIVVPRGLGVSGHVVCAWFGSV
jgi:hypothetical protein